AVIVGRGKDLSIASEARALHDSVHDSAAAAPAEDHRVRTLQDLDPIHVVEVAEILNVVAKTVDEEVGGRAVPTQGKGIAIALAGGRTCAGNEGQQFSDGAYSLILDLLFGNDGQGLRYVANVGVGLRRGCRGLGTI